MIIVTANIHQLSVQINYEAAAWQSLLDYSFAFHQIKILPISSRLLELFQQHDLSLVSAAY